MQVNSAQDYVTLRKRRIIAATYNTVPPPVSRRNNQIFTSAEANGATQYQRNVYAFQGARGGAIGGVSWSSQCCLANGAVGAPFAFQTTTDRGIVRFNIIPPLSVKATASKV